MDRVIATALQAGAGPDIVPSGGTDARGRTWPKPASFMDLSDAFAASFGWG